MAALAALYLGLVNTVTFAAFALDKRAAAGRARRVPERRLLMLAAFGGSPAALLAQQALRHKTRKEPFRSRLRVIAMAQAAAVAVVAYLCVR